MRYDGNMWDAIARSHRVARGIAVAAFVFAALIFIKYIGTPQIVATEIHEGVIVDIRRSTLAGRHNDTEWVFIHVAVGDREPIVSTVPPNWEQTHGQLALNQTVAVREETYDNGKTNWVVLLTSDW